MFFLIGPGQSGFPITEHIWLFSQPVIGAKIPPHQSFPGFHQSGKIFFAVFYLPTRSTALTNRFIYFPLTHFFSSLL
jgi:hypothetical protein